MTVNEKPGSIAFGERSLPSLVQCAQQCFDISARCCLPRGWREDWEREEGRVATGKAQRWDQKKAGGLVCDVQEMLVSPPTGSPWSGAPHPRGWAGFIHSQVFPGHQNRQNLCSSGADTLVQELIKNVYNQIYSV